MMGQENGPPLFSFPQAKLKNLSSGTVMEQIGDYVSLTQRCFS